MMLRLKIIRLSSTNVYNKEADQPVLPQFDQSLCHSWPRQLRPKLKFYLFPLTHSTLKKRPYPKYFISIFSQELLFFKFHCKLSERIVQCKKCYISLKKIFLVFVNSLNIGN